MVGRPVHLLHANNIARPQLSFKDKVDNSVSAVFVPKIRRKPNAIEPLDLEPTRGVVAPALASHIAGLGGGVGGSATVVSYPHPYQPELDRYEPLDELLKRVEPQRPGAVEGEAVWVDSKEGLDALVKVLKGEKEIAIDLEAHGYRAYESFACLMQLSTRTTDYLIDVLALRSDVHVLNDAFTDPSKVKVRSSLNHAVCARLIVL
jgi:exosome complex exonuclease RRP6